ncbi:MAG: sulfurtransferase [Sulfuricurvum sp. PC08-66]|nr:MAG: sulfurtransferase [Sulfuricurvum sp. PC08-66]
MSETIKKIDPESEEFKTELEKTKRFTDKVINQFNWSYNPDNEININIQFGLTRNKLIYGKRYCPCFFVQNDETDRVCPCAPAIEHEIPEEGVCHCQIFCTPEYASRKSVEETADEVAHQHSRGLTKAEVEAILARPQLDTDELQALIEARDLGMVKFKILDVREWMENKGARIVGTDHLIPTTSFYDALAAANLDKEIPVIVYCHVGSRSAHCQRILKAMEFKHVGNLTHGIVSYRGPLARG